MEFIQKKQKEKAKDDKAIKFGKVCAILLITFFSVSFITEEEFNFITIIFNCGLVFGFLELFSIIINFSKKLGEIITSRKIVSFLMLLFILNYIFSQSIDYAFIVVLFILWFWIFREIFKSRKLRMIVIMVMILISSIIVNIHKEIYYRVIGKMVEKKIEVPVSKGIETAQSECENEMPDKCNFIRWEEAGFYRPDYPCWGCRYFNVKCYYGCQKSYFE